jgi:hypothetical protein
VWPENNYNLFPVSVKLINKYLTFDFDFLFSNLFKYKHKNVIHQPNTGNSRAQQAIKLRAERPAA